MNYKTVLVTLDMIAINNVHKFIVMYCSTEYTCIVVIYYYQYHLYTTSSMTVTITIFMAVLDSRDSFIF